MAFGFTLTRPGLPCRLTRGRLHRSEYPKPGPLGRSFGAFASSPPPGPGPWPGCALLCRGTEQPNERVEPVAGCHGHPVRAAISRSVRSWAQRRRALRWCDWC